MYISPPSEEERLEILKVLALKSPIASSVDLRKMATRSNGKTGADLTEWIRKSAVRAIQRNSQEIKELDLLESLEI